MLAEAGAPRSHFTGPGVAHGVFKNYQKILSRRCEKTHAPYWPLRPKNLKTYCCNMFGWFGEVGGTQKMKHFWPDRYRSFSGARLFLNLRFSDFRFWNMANKVWYYQSGPKSVSINPYGIPEPPKPLRNCQSLDWVQKTKKFESLAEILTFLKTRQGCTWNQVPSTKCQVAGTWYQGSPGQD